MAITRTFKGWLPLYGTNNSVPVYYTEGNQNNAEEAATVDYLPDSVEVNYLRGDYLLTAAANAPVFINEKKALYKIDDFNNPQSFWPLGYIKSINGIPYGGLSGSNIDNFGYANFYGNCGPLMGSTAQKYPDYNVESHSFYRWNPSNPIPLGETILIVTYDVGDILSFSIMREDGRDIYPQPAGGIYPRYITSYGNSVYDAITIDEIYVYSDKSEADLIAGGKKDPYDEGGTSGTGGGGGSYDDSSDNSIEQEESYNSASLGLYTTYACDAGTIATIGSALYADNFLEALNLGLLKVLFNSPIDALIQLMAFPFDVPASYSGNVKFGSIELKVPSEGQMATVSAPIVSNSNVYIDWGTVGIQEYWGSFLDYAPQTKIDLHLPWGAGHVQIDPAEVMNHGIRVTSLIDITKGQCVHSVYGRTNIGTFSCQCGQQIPITALDTSGKALGIATSAIAIAATAGFSGAAQSAGIAAANSASIPVGSTLAERTSIQREAIARAETTYRARQRNAGRVAAASALAAARVPVQFPRNGSFGMGSAHLDIQKPYVVISRPVQNFPRAYGDHYGYPCNMYLPLGALSGYTEIGEVHLDGISCTAEEKDEIDKLLKGGIIL